MRDCSRASAEEGGSFWDMPFEFYSLIPAPADDQAKNDYVMMGIDTTPMVGEEWEILDPNSPIDDPIFNVDKKRLSEVVEFQADFAVEQLRNSEANWKIAFGHHPFVSNGNHGTAGRYDVTLDSTENCKGGVARLIQLTPCRSDMPLISRIVPIPSKPGPENSMRAAVGTVVGAYGNFLLAALREWTPLLPTQYRAMRGGPRCILFGP